MALLELLGGVILGWGIKNAVDSSDSESSSASERSRDDSDSEDRRSSFPWMRLSDRDPFDNG